MKAADADARERFGLRIAGVATLVFVAVIALMVVPENGILRDPVQHTVMPSPFIKGIVPLIIFFFFVVSLAYGIATGKIRRRADLPQLMIEPMKEMAGFIVMVFAGAVRGDVQLEQHGQVYGRRADGSAGEFRHERCSGVCRSCAAVGFSVCLSPAARPSGRFWRRSSCQCLCCWAFTRRLRRSCFVSLIHRCCAGAGVTVCAVVSRLSTALPAGCPPRHLLFAGAPYPLIFLAVWLLLLVGWYLVGLPIGPASIRGCLNPPMRGDGRLSLTRYLHFELTGRFPGSGEYAESARYPRSSNSDIP